MGKQQDQTIVMQIRGSEQALVATTDMLQSVQEALQNQYPKLQVLSTLYIGEDATKPMIVMPIKRKRASK